MHNRITWRCFIGQCTIESTWRCFDWVMHNRSHVALFTLVISSKHVIQDHEEHCDALFRITEDRRCVGLIDLFLGRSKQIQRKA